MKPERGRQLWGALHTYAYLYPAVATAEDARAARAWLAEFSRALRPGGCSCHQEWEDLVAAVPPPLGGAGEFYWWTVAAHDFVNWRLGKPLHAPEWSLQHPFLSPAGAVMTAAATG
jgi:hypothetical protein